MLLKDVIFLGFALQWDLHSEAGGRLACPRLPIGRPDPVRRPGIRRRRRRHRRHHGLRQEDPPDSAADRGRTAVDDGAQLGIRPNEPFDCRGEARVLHGGRPWRR